MFRLRSIPQLSLDIAREHVAKINRWDHEVTWTQSGGRIHRWDGQRSMKAAMTATEFASAYVGSLTWAAVSILLPQRAKDLDYVKLEDRLIALGITDPSLLSGCAILRDLHRELYHGKASDQILIAQREARRALLLAERLQALLVPRLIATEALTWPSPIADASPP